MIEPRRTLRGAVAIFSIALFAGCQGPAGARGGLTSEQLKQLPPEIGEAYDVFARRCSRCHSLARPLNAQVNDLEHWKRYVARMRRHPGSGISDADAEVILRFLAYYVHERAQAKGTP